MPFSLNKHNVPMPQNRQWLLWLLARFSAWNRENGDLVKKMGTWEQWYWSHHRLSMPVFQCWHMPVFEEVLSNTRNWSLTFKCISTVSNCPLFGLVWCDLPRYVSSSSLMTKKSSVGETDLTQLLEELETPPIAQNEALFEGHKCPSKVQTLKIVFGGLPHL